MNKKLKEKFDESVNAVLPITVIVLLLSIFVVPMETGTICGHCEARVKKALEALPEVKEAVVSHEAGTAVVTLESAVSDEALKEAVEAQDYKVISVQ